MCLGKGSQSIVKTLICRKYIQDWQLKNWACTDTLGEINAEIRRYQNRLPGSRYSIR
jgi:hypothetical protein